MRSIRKSEKAEQTSSFFFQKKNTARVLKVGQGSLIMSPRQRRGEGETLSATLEEDAAEGERIKVKFPELVFNHQQVGQVVQKQEKPWEDFELRNQGQAFPGRCVAFVYMHHASDRHSSGVQAFICKTAVVQRTSPRLQNLAQRSL